MTNNGGDPPNSLSIFSDHAKTIIGLSSAILAISGSFVTAFLERPLDLSVYAVLWGSWILLALSIVWSIFAVGRVVREARLIEKPGSHLGEPDWDCISLFSNLAFWSLFLGLVLLVVFAVLVQESGKNAGHTDLSTALRATEAQGNSICKVNRKRLRLQAANYEKSGDQWTILLAWPCLGKAPNSYDTLYAVVSRGVVYSISDLVNPYR